MRGSAPASAVRWKLVRARRPRCAVHRPLRGSGAAPRPL